MTTNRRLRACLAAGLTLGLAASLAAPVEAAPPKKVATPVITSAPAAATTARNATFTFTSSTPGATYTCSRDGAAAVACTSGVTYSALADGTHSFTVRANAPKMRTSNPASHSWSVDATPPAAPSIGGVPAITRTAIAPTFSDSSADVAGYQCSVDAGAFVACTSGAPVSVSPDGRHTLTVRAVDLAGNIGPSTTMAWLLDTFVAKPFVLTGPNAVTSATSATFTFDSHETDATFTCAVDGGAFSGCTTGKVYTALNSSNPGVPHTFSVRATDTVGNVATSDLYQWTVKNSVPVSIAWDVASLPVPVTAATGATIKFTVTGSAALECRLDGTLLPACLPAGTAVAGLGDGPHTFTVLADKGASTQNSATVSWEVDATPPAPPSLFGPPALTNATSVTVSVVPSRLDDRVACQLDNVVRPCTITSPVVVTGLGDGVHVVTASATDKAGNTSSASLAWAVDTVAPTVSVQTPATVTGASTVSFNEDTRTADVSPSLTLSNGTPVATNRVCLNAAGAAVACADSAVRVVRLAATTTLVPGETYVVRVNAPGEAPVSDVAGNAAPSTSSTFRAAVVQQEDSPATVQTWRRAPATAAKGGSYVVEGRAGASASWTFTGTAFTLFAATGPTFGIAKVYVDGIYRASYNQYAKAVGFTSARSIKGLAFARHTVKVVVTGKKGSRLAKGADVGIDAFAVGASVQKTPTLVQRLGRVKAAGASGLYRAVTPLAGATFAMAFTGAGVTWVHPTGPAYGLAAVYVDGVKKAVVDSWSASAKDRVSWVSPTLAAGRHTVRIVVLGTKRAVSKGALVGIDFLKVR